MNKGIPICTTDVYQIKLDQNPLFGSVIRKENLGKPIAGRKFHGISICEGQLHVNGGLN